MSAELVTEIGVGARRSVRARAVSALGPTTVLAGMVWAVIQPYRLTLLHPFHQGFWWLVAEPQLYVIGVGVLFHRFIARSLLADLDEAPD